LTLGIPVQHYVEAIGENGEHRRLGYIVVKTGESERILPHAVQQRFEMSSSGALIAATRTQRGRCRWVVVTGAGLARVEQYDLRAS
jgi:hypothetical protein